MLANYVLEDINAPGSSVTVNLAGAPTGRRSFASSFTTGSTVYYFIDDGSQTEWGYGTFTSGSPNTFARSTVIGNTSGTTARLNFSGAARIYCAVPASRVVYRDSSDNVVLGGSLFVSLGVALSSTLYAASTITAGGAMASGGQITGASFYTPGAMTADGSVNGGGYKTRAGWGAGTGTNNFNINWTGAGAYLWVDTTNLGKISFVSDPRVKRDIVDAPAGALDRVMAWRVVEYEFADVSIFRADGQRRIGFLADQVQGITPSAVNGDAGAVDEDGQIMPQNLDPVALIAELTKAVQELTARLVALESP